MLLVGRLLSHYILKVFSGTIIPTSKLLDRCFRVAILWTFTNRLVLSRTFAIDSHKARGGRTGISVSRDVIFDRTSSEFTTEAL